MYSNLLKMEMGFKTFSICIGMIPSLTSPILGIILELKFQASVNVFIFFYFM